MLYCRWVLVAMETHFHVFTPKYQYFKKFFEGTLFKIKFATTFQQYVLQEYRQFGGCQGASQSCHTQLRPLATAKRAIFLQNILWESCSKFYFKQCSLKKFLKIVILWREYMEMCFHSNQHPWAIKHPFISLHLKYQLLSIFIFP